MLHHHYGVLGIKPSNNYQRNHTPRRNERETKHILKQSSILPRQFSLPLPPHWDLVSMCSWHFNVNPLPRWEFLAILYPTSYSIEVSLAEHIHPLLETKHQGLCPLHTAKWRKSATIGTLRFPPSLSALFMAVHAYAWVPWKTT
jgi:hypothetical protein